MKKEEISEIIGNIDEKYVEEASTFAPAADTVQSSVKASAVKPKERKKHRIVWIAAACILLTAVVSSTVFIMGAEAKEYNAALAFFEGNGLSTEGLSRSEIKAVYRDIETRSFSFGKTADVILRAVPGWEITQDEPTPGDLAAIWDRNVWNAVPKAGFGYRKDYRYVFDEKKGYEIFKKSIVECYRDGELLWTAEFSDFCVEGCAHTPNGTAPAA